MKKIIEFIKESKFNELKNELLNLNPADIAQIFEIVKKEEVILLFRLLPKDLAAEVFSYMDKNDQRRLVELLSDQEIENILKLLFMDDAIDFLEELPANIVKKILRNTDEEKRKIINQFLNYPENSAGSLMTIEFIDLKKEMTVKTAIERIKEIGLDKEVIETCYVIDKNRKLEGFVLLRTLILSDENLKVEDIMTNNVSSIFTKQDQEDVADKFKKYDFMSMPVVDNENRLVGIITIDDIVDVIEEENTEDFQKMAAMEPTQEEYLKTSSLILAKHRIVWLLVLMISATFTGNIIKKFEDVLQSVVLLAAFIPMLMDTGGNAGSQSSTLIIRGLALGEIKLKDALQVFIKELKVSLIVGICLSILNFLRLYFIEKTDFKISLTVCTSLFFTVVLAKVVGGLLPIIAKKFKMDPAIMASPLITTIVDAFALTIYFSMASWIIGL